MWSSRVQSFWSHGQQDPAAFQVAAVSRRTYLKVHLKFLHTITKNSTPYSCILLVLCQITVTEIKYCADIVAFQTTQNFKAWMRTHLNLYGLILWFSLPLSLTVQKLVCSHILVVPISHKRFCLHYSLRLFSAKKSRMSVRSRVANFLGQRVK